MSSQTAQYDRGHKVDMKPILLFLKYPVTYTLTLGIVQIKLRASTSYLHVTHLLLQRVINDVQSQSF